MLNKKNLNYKINKTINQLSAHEYLVENVQSNSDLLKMPISNEEIGEKEGIFIFCSNIIKKINNHYSSNSSPNLNTNNNSAKIFKTKISSIVLIVLFFLIYYRHNMVINSQLNRIENYIKKNLDGYLFHLKSLFKKVDNPKISVVISVFNGEGYIKPVVRSVQNQNLLDLEIIIVDDGSQDNSVQVIKELMEEDPRIKLLLNGVNRGTLYTKSRGALNAKGKYVMSLDQDNLYASENAFSILYDEAEKNQLDILGFSAILTPIEVSLSTVAEFFNYYETPVIRKPNIFGRFFPVRKFKRTSNAMLCSYFIRTKIYLDVLKDLGDDIINRNIDDFDDSIVIFLLSRKALRLKHIKKIFYIILGWPVQNKVIEFHDKIKKEARERRHCISYITFSEVLFLFGDNNRNDKERAEYVFMNKIIRNKECNIKQDLIDEIKRLSKLFLDNEYISYKAKNEIKLLINNPIYK